MLHRAFAGILLRPPAQKFRAMPETSAGEMIKLYFDHTLRVDRLHSMECFVLHRLNPPGAFYDSPGIGPGEPFNMQLALRIVF
jgi:hypothetical protein